MPRYYFDIRANGELALDVEGLELPDIREAENQAAQTLGDMARDALPALDRLTMTIEVRSTTQGPRLFKAAFSFETERVIFHSDRLEE